MEVWVVLPTYCERETLPEVVSGTLEALPDARVLVVDDASPDGTGKVADELAAGDPRVRVIHRPGKAGLASAYVEGFRTALREGAELLVEMDADGSHDPAELPALVEAAKSADVVVGSRYIPGGKVHNWSPFRLLLSRGGNLYARALLRLSIRDATSGYRAYHRRVLEALDLGAIRSEGYAFQIEMVLRAARAGFRVVEVPITFWERRAGRSKLSRRIVLEALIEVARWALRPPA